MSCSHSEKTAAPTFAACRLYQKSIVRKAVYQNAESVTAALRSCYRHNKGIQMDKGTVTSVGVKKNVYEV
ncbi:hypothetical protein TNCV_3243181 [Trichonephila clavipes]|nr:hypothetical protein TNCV_3243181 [Trichonephila clavipes]